MADEIKHSKHYVKRDTRPEMLGKKKVVEYIESHDKVSNDVGWYMDKFLDKINSGDLNLKEKP